MMYQNQERIFHIFIAIDQKPETEFMNWYVIKNKKTENNTNIY